MAFLAMRGRSEQAKRLEELAKAQLTLLTEFRDAVARSPQVTEKAISEIVERFSRELRAQIVEHDKRTKETIRTERTTVVVVTVTATPKPKPKPKATVTCNPTPVVGNCRR